MGETKFKSENYQNLGGINTKSSQYLTGQFEVLNLENFDFTKPGSWTKRPGTGLYSGASVSGRVHSITEFERLNGESYIIAGANTNLYKVTSSAISAFASGFQNNALWDFVPFVDRLFAANGSNFVKTDGTNTFKVGLPEGASLNPGVTHAVGGGLSGVFFVGYGYLNDRGYLGPAGNGYTISLNGLTFGSITYLGLTTPADFGITGIAFYRSNPGLLDRFQITQYAPAGATTFTDTGFSLTLEPEPSSFFFTLAPRYMEIYNNQLFMAGFSAFPSTAWFSDIGEPESVEPTYNFEVRTNDGDRITAMKAFQGDLVVFKERSFSKLIGDNPTTFSLVEITDQYGCISNRAVASFNNTLLFLDRKGIVRYDGSGYQILSNKIEPVFLAMNVDAARDNAVAIHNRLRNEIWFAIPCDGATFNNCVVVYDYLAEAFTTFKGVNISSLSVIQGTLSAPTAFFGGYTGFVGYYGASFYSDLGAGMTCVAKTRFFSDDGKSIQKVFRRLFLDVDPLTSQTGIINISFFQDYATTPGLTRTMYQSPFQSRIDYGISAKAMAVEFVNISDDSPLRINGFTIEHRVQRRV